MKTENKTWTLYTHTTPDGMVYVGITSNLKTRWNPSHYVGNIRKEIEKWGWNRIEHRQISTFSDKLSSHRAEDALIVFCRANNISLNMIRSGTNLNDDGTIKDFKTRRKEQIDYYRARQRKWYSEHREEHLEWIRKYRAEHKEEHKAKKRERAKRRKLQCQQ